MEKRTKACFLAVGKLRHRRRLGLRSDTRDECRRQDHGVEVRLGQARFRAEPPEREARADSSPLSRALGTGREGGTPVVALGMWVGDAGRA